MISGNNFVKLRDVMRLFDIGVTYDEATQGYRDCYVYAVYGVNARNECLSFLLASCVHNGNTRSLDLCKSIDIIAPFSISSVF